MLDLVLVWTCCFCCVAAVVCFGVDDFVILVWMIIWFMFLCLINGLLAVLVALGLVIQIQAVGVYCKYLVLVCCYDLDVLFVSLARCCYLQFDCLFYLVSGFSWLFTCLIVCCCLGFGCWFCCLFIVYCWLTLLLLLYMNRIVGFGVVLLIILVCLAWVVRCLLYLQWFYCFGGLFAVCVCVYYFGLGVKCLFDLFCCFVGTV